jgi:mxaJ protein
MTRAWWAVWAIAGAAVTVPSLASGRASGAAETLRVCADPNNMPFSNSRGEGLENRLANLLAQHMDARLVYTWWPQRRGFVRMTLQAGTCDVIIGVPTAFDLARTTRPYYRSSYGFLSRKSLQPAVTSFDDPRLQQLRIGVQMVGDDFANSPPAHALSARGLITNITGFSVLGNYREPNPPARIVDAVAAGTVDVAAVWGPLAGYFGARSRVPLQWHALRPPIDSPALPFVFDISMAVRRGDDRRHARIDAFIAARHAEINAILDAYHVPRVASHGTER